MHRALCLYEILVNIFGYCCPPEAHWMPGRNGFTTDLAALARTCRTFKEPALDVLWSELVDLTPLVRCLPGAYQYLNGCYSFKRRPTEEEWVILRSYAHRIWHINGYSNVNGWLDNDNLIATCGSPVAAPLFPNLRSFYWQGLALIPVAHIAVPSLTTLDLHFTHGHVPALNDFLNSVGDLCPNIGRLRFHVFHVQVLHETITHHMRRWKNLHVLDFHGVIVNADMVSCLSEIPALSYLSFTLIPGIIDWFPTSGSPSVFSGLIQIEVTSESLEPVTRLLACTRLPVLENHMVVCPRRPSKEAFRSYTTALRNVCSPDSFTQFVFFNDKSVRLRLLGTPIIAGGSDCCLTLDDLRPYMAFVNLCQLRIDLKWSVDLSDGDLLTLVSAWPNVQFLYINEKWGWRTTGGTTLRGLLQLLEKRRSLTELCVAIKTQSYIELPRNVDVGFDPSPSGPVRVNLTDSLIQATDVPMLIDVFVELNPYFYFFVAWDGLDAEARQGAAGYRREWRRVFDGVTERLSGSEINIRP